MNQERTENPAELYQQYFVPGIHSRWTPLFVEYADPQSDDNVIDVACGTGVVTREAAKRVGKNGKVVGIDINPDMLRVARQLPEPDEANINWIEADVTNKLPDGNFDLSLCQQGLQFVSEKQKALEEMRRVLKPDGRITLSVWQDLDRHPVYEALSEAEADYLNKPVEALATPFNLGDENRLHTLLDSAGFRTIKISPETRNVTFPSPDRFVMLTLLAAASIIPEVEMDRAERAELVSYVSKEIAETLRPYINDNTITFPMHANIATAQV